MTKKYNFPEMLVTDRFILEAVSEFHAEEAYETLDKDRAYIGEFLDWCTPEYSLEDTIGFYNMQAEAFEDEETFDYIIIDKESDKIIGSVGIVMKWKEVGNIGYWLASDQQGRGVITECVKELKEFAFNETDIIRLNLHILVENIKSIKVAQRCNFLFNNIIYSHRINNKGIVEDVLEYTYLKDESKMKKLDIKQEKLKDVFGVK